MSPSTARPRSIRPLVVVVTTAVLLAACGSGGDDEAATSSVPDSSSTTVTTDAPVTTVRSTSTSVAPSSTTSTTSADTTTSTVVVTSAAPTTVPPLTADGLVLDDLGVGPVGLGTPDAEAIATFTSVLGAPVRDERGEYPIPYESGGFVSADDLYFGQPFGRFVCFANALCASFGGPAADRLVMVGWSYRQDGVMVEPVLATADGVKVGNRWSDVAAKITVYESGCYSTGYGDAGGIRLTLLSVGDFFGDYDELGNPIPVVPRQEDVTIVAMEAGEHEAYLYEDC